MTIDHPTGRQAVASPNRRTCVVLTHFAPVPSMGGSSIRIASTVQALMKDFDVVVICSERDERMVERSMQFCRNVGARFHHDPGAFTAQYRHRDFRRMSKYLWYVPWRFEKRLLRTLTPAISDVIRSADLIWQFKLGPLALCAIPNLRNRSLVVDLDDLEDQVIMRNKALPLIARFLYAHRIRSRRRRILTSAHSALVCSSLDAARLNAPCAVDVLPNTYPVHQKFRGFVLGPDTTRWPTIVVIGIMSYQPNRHGVQWFLDTTWDLIRSNIPDARLIIAGLNSDLNFHSDPKRGVQVIGTFEHAWQILKDASAVIVPVHFGSGTRIKILEAMSLGIPVVSTTLGAEGIDLVNRQSALIADTPVEFAHCVTEVLEDKDLASRLAREGRDLFDSRYSPEVFSRTVSAIALRALQDVPDSDIATQG